MSLSSKILKSDTPYVSVAETLHYVRDYSSVTVAELKEACRIDSDDTSYERVLYYILKGVKEMADDYIQRPSFEEPTSGTDDAIPAPIELWVLQTSVRKFQQRQNGVIKEEIKDAQITEWGGIDMSPLSPYRTFFKM